MTQFEILYEQFLLDLHLLEEADVNKIIPIAQSATKNRELHTQAVENNKPEEAEKQKQELLKLRKDLYELLKLDFSPLSKRKEPLTEEEFDQRIDTASRNSRLSGIEHLHSRILKTL